MHVLHEDEDHDVSIGEHIEPTRHPSDLLVAVQRASRGVCFRLQPRSICKPSDHSFDRIAKLRCLQDENLILSLGELAQTTRGIITIVTAVVALVGMAPFLFIEVRRKCLSIRLVCATPPGESSRLSQWWWPSSVWLSCS